MYGLWSNITSRAGEFYCSHFRNEDDMKTYSHPLCIALKLFFPLYHPDLCLKSFFSLTLKWLMNTVLILFVHEIYTTAWRQYVAVDCGSMGRSSNDQGGRAGRFPNTVAGQRSAETVSSHVPSPSLSPRLRDGIGDILREGLGAP